MGRPREYDFKIYGPGERTKSPPNRWCVARLWINDTRKDITLSGNTDPEEARSIAREYIAAATERASEPRGRPERPRTFRELAERYSAVRRISLFEQRHVDRLVAARLASLGHGPLGDVLIEELTPALAQEAAGVLYGRRTEKTMNRAAIAPFSAIVHFGADNHWCSWMRIKGFRTVDRRTPRLAEGDAERLLAAAAAARPKKCDRYKADHPYRHIFLLFLFRQGWRITESLRLTWSQVDLVASRFRNVCVDKGKAVKAAIVMHPDVYEALAGLPEGEPERALRERRGRVFPWFDRGNVYRWLVPFCNDFGIHFRPHMARVEFASQLSEAGQTDTKIMNVCTWTDTRSISRYTRTSERECEQTIALVGRKTPADTGS
ncbi:MAG: site-specific integrase [Rhodospirillales bacterium]|nr:site-specific integrase [Rhodospirillales bacterium]